MSCVKGRRHGLVACLHGDCRCIGTRGVAQRGHGLLGTKDARWNKPQTAECKQPKLTGGDRSGAGRDVLGEGDLTAGHVWAGKKGRTGL